MPVRALFLPVLLIAALFVPSTRAADSMKDKDKPKETKWLTSIDQAMALSRKQEKPILAYFSGSDWCPWCQKLDHDVLNTEMFQEWTKANVILLQIDYPREKNQSSTIRQQNERLKLKYSISKTPTFILMDGTGSPIARASFEEAKLRDDELKGQPKAWIAYLESVVRNKPKDEELDLQKDLPLAMMDAKKHYVPLLMIITQGHRERVMADKAALLKNQVFVKFVNRNVSIAEVEWPEDSDTSKPAEFFRNFATSHKLEAAPIQLVVWDAPYDKIVSRVTAFSLDHVDQLVGVIQAKLPKIDYSGAWIDDFRQARAIASQTQRFIFLSFVNMEGEWSNKMDQEIYQSPEFKAYAHKHLVLVKLNFPTATTQPEGLHAQNKMLAEMFNVRGFPTAVILNPLSQKIAESKYLKGGPNLFLSQLDAAIQKDSDRRSMLKD